MIQSWFVSQRSLLFMEKIRWILKNHKPKPLDKKVRRELQKIIKAAERGLVG